AAALPLSRLADVALAPPPSSLPAPVPSPSVRLRPACAPPPAPRRVRPRCHGEMRRHRRSGGRTVRPTWSWVVRGPASPGRRLGPDRATGPPCLPHAGQPCRPGGGRFGPTVLPHPPTH